MNQLPRDEDKEQEKRIISAFGLRGKFLNLQVKEKSDLFQFLKK